MAIRFIKGFGIVLLIFCACVSSFAQADNDPFANAQRVSGSEATVKAYLGGASLEPGEPDHALARLFPTGLEVNESVWFSWTSPTTGILDVSISDGLLFPVAALYRGAAVNQLAPIGPAFRPGGAAFPVEAGVEYKIAIGRVNEPGFDWSQEVQVNLRVVATPANDSFANAISINEQIGYEYFLIPGTLEPGEPPQHAGGSLWWRWTADSSGTASFLTGPPRLSGRWTVFEGGSLETLEWVETVPGTQWLFPSSLIFSVRSNVTYHIAYSGLAEPLGAALLYGSVAPISLSGPMQTVERGGQLPLSFDILPSNPPSDATLRLEMRNGLGWVESRLWNPPFPAGFVVTNVPAGTNQYRIVYEEDIRPPVPPLPQMQAISVDPGPFSPGRPRRSFASDTLTFVVRHPADAFAESEMLAGTNTQFNVDFFGSTFEANEPPFVVFDSNPKGSVWYKWSAPHDGALRISRAGVRFNELALDVYKGTTLTNLHLVPGRAEGTPFFEYRVFRVQEGAEYFLRFNAPWSHNLTMDLRLDPVPVNDNFADAIALPTEGTFVDLGAASSESAEPDSAADAWYKVQPAVNGILWCRIANESATVRLYRGATLETLELITAGSSFQEELTAGLTYYVKVTNWAWDKELPWLTSSFAPIPVNDHFVDRIPLAVPQQLVVSLAAATIETNEAVSPAISASVWYSFIASETGVYALAPAEFISVWTGTALENLIAVPSLGNDSGLYQLTAGTTYAVRASGPRGSEVHIATRVHTSAAPGDHFDQPLTGPAVFPMFLATESPNDPAVIIPDHSTNAPVQLKDTTWLVWTAPANGRLSLWALGPPIWIVAYKNAPLEELIPLAGRANFLELPVTAGQQYRFLMGSAFEPEFRIAEQHISLSFNTLRIASPEGGSVFTPGTPVTFAISDPIPGLDPEISSVTFFARGPFGMHIPGTATNAPFKVTMLNMLPGVYDVSASVRTTSGDTIALKSIAMSIRTEEVENDRFENAKPIAGRYYEESITTNAVLNATVQAAEPGPTNVNFPNSIRGTLWYRWTAPASGTVWVSSAPYWGTEGVLWKGSALTNLVGAPVTNGFTRFAVERGQEYFIQLHVGGLLARRWSLNLETVRPAHDHWRSFSAGDPIDFALNTTELAEDLESISIYWHEQLVSSMTSPPWTSVVTHLPARQMAPSYSVLRAKSGEVVTNFVGFLRIYPRNSSAERPSLLTATNLTIDFSSFDTSSYGEPLPGPPLYFRYTPGTNLYLTLPDAKLNVTNLTSGEAVARVAAAAESPAVFELMADFEYLLAVSEPRGTSVTFEFPEAPVNDYFTNALALSLAGDGQQILWPVVATIESGEALSQTQPGSVWYHWTASENGTLAVSVAAKLFTGVAVSNLVEIPPLAEGIAFFHVTRGSSYRLAVYPSAYRAQHFTAEYFSDPLAADQFADAIILDARSGVVTAKFLTTSYELEEPAHHSPGGAGSVWWKWIAPTSGELWLWPMTGRLLLYKGTTLTNLEFQEPASNISNSRYLVTAGRTYYFMVERIGENEAGFGYSFYAKPPNDTAAGAQVLSGTSSTVSGAHILATREFQEPLHAGAYGGRSVWYRWRAERDGELHIRTEHRQVAAGQGVPLLAVYKGTATGDLIVSRKSPSLINEVGLTVDAGTDYLVAVDFQGPLAEFSLQLAFIPRPFELAVLGYSTGVLQFSFESDRFVYLQSSTNLVDWATISRYSASAPKISTMLTTNAPAVFFRAIQEP